MSLPKTGAEHFATAFRSRGLAVTHQRLAICEAVAESRAHPGVDEIYRTVRKRLPTVSRGTVYRTLETLCREGLVADVSHVRGTARFEAAAEPHHHMVCLSCRRIIDLHDPALDGLAPSSRGGGEARGFEVTGYQIQFQGHCGDCRRKRPAGKQVKRRKR
jgi:Fe2+ or Zn2+ uptake regulation protein